MLMTNKLSRKVKLPAFFIFAFRQGRCLHRGWCLPTTPFIAVSLCPGCCLKNQPMNTTTADSFNTFLFFKLSNLL
jgi:hypothetical protein